MEKTHIDQTLTNISSENSRHLDSGFCSTRRMSIASCFWSICNASYTVSPLL